MIRKWIRKIVNEVMEETMNEIAHNADVDYFSERAAEIAAERIDVSAEEVFEHLNIDASDIAEYVDTYDVAYNMDKDDIASEISISEVANEIDVDALASYVSGRMSDKIDVDYKEVANNLSMDELACEIDVGILAEQIMDNDSMFTAVMQKALALHDQDITHMFQVLADALNNVAEERREVEE